MDRSSGVLMHIASLPSPYGIGTLGKAAFEFVDFLKAGGQKYWQILPVGPTSYGDSPYQSFSSFAGNPYFIDLDLLVQDGLLEKSDFAQVNWGDNEEKIDYDILYQQRYTVLKLAFQNGYRRDMERVGQFIREHDSWLYNYALFMALKDHFEGVSWLQWPEDIKLRKHDAMKQYTEELIDEVNFYTYLQYLFYKQWTELKAYANEKDVSIIGDIPIYVALDSADTWANSQVFWLDEKKNPVCVAGCPPDYFSPTGQLWGNPLYNWTYLKKTNYEWWVTRLGHALKVFNTARIDHFRGFEAYYAIPFGNETAEEGIWKKGPDIGLFRAFKRALGKDLPIIAEDLGFLTPEVKQMLQKTGFPGMRVLQFAFDGDGENPYLPHMYERNTVAYVGTHDNDTLKGWFTTCGGNLLGNAEHYFNLTNEEGYHFGMIRGAMSSVANLVVVQMQDYLFLDTTCRMNTPGLFGGNWQWRMKKDAITEKLQAHMLELTKRYHR